MTIADNLPGLAAVVSAIVFLSGLVQGALGFGYAIAALTALPVVLIPQHAHVVISLSGIPVMAMAVWTTREEADWIATGKALAGAGVALPIGLLAFGSFSADGLIRATGLAILVLMLVELAQRTPKTNQHGTSASALLAGLISGFLAGAVSIGGPPIVAYAVKQQWTPLKTKAFITRVLLAISLYKGAGLMVGGFIKPALAWQGAWAALFAVFGVWLGARLSRHISAEFYRRCVTFILIGLSSWWLYRGAPERPSDMPRPRPAQNTRGVNLGVGAGLVSEVPTPSKDHRQPMFVAGFNNLIIVT